MKSIKKKLEDLVGPNLGVLQEDKEEVHHLTCRLAKKAISLNSATQLAVTKLDVLFPDSAGVRKFEKLPTESKKFIENIEAETGLKVSLVGTGADVDDIIDRRVMK